MDQAVYSSTSSSCTSFQLFDTRIYNLLILIDSYKIQSTSPALPLSAAASICFILPPNLALPRLIQEAGKTLRLIWKPTLPNLPDTSTERSKITKRKTQKKNGCATHVGLVVSFLLFFPAVGGLILHLSTCFPSTCHMPYMSSGIYSY